MRASERKVRMHAFMAHYIKAREALDANGFTHSVNDPHLIEMARRGVTATQFMYNNSFRPAFAASHFGKIVARFQLWAWNSVKFRQEIYRQAKIHGFKQDTPEFDRFRRMATLDMLSQLRVHLLVRFQPPFAITLSDTVQCPAAMGLNLSPPGFFYCDLALNSPMACHWALLIESTSV